MTRPPLRFADLLESHEVGAVAPDAAGRRAAYVVRAAVAPDHGPAGSELAIVALAGGPPLVVATAAEGVHDLPLWAPDGERLAFAADRDGGGLPRPCVREPDGRIRALAAPEGAVEALRWSADGRRLLALIAEPGSDRAGARGGTAIGAGAAAAAIVRRPRQAWRRLALLDVDGAAWTAVGPAALNVWEFDWRGTGPVAAVVSERPDEGAWYDAVLATIDPEPGGGARIVHRPRRQIQSPAIRADGTIALVEGLASDRTEVQGEVVVLGPEDGPTRRFPVEAMTLSWLADGRLFLVAQDGLGCACGALDPATGAVDRWWRGDALVGLANGAWAAVSDDGGTVVAGFQAPDVAPAPARLDGRGAGAAWRPIADPNADLRDHRTPPVERVRWTAEDGLAIEGLLVRPVDHDGAPGPLVVAVHGGPTNAWTAAFSPARMQLGIALLDAGFSLLLPNVRGSSGRGQPFATANVGDMGGADLGDLLAGIDALADRGAIDPRRVGITGVSYGGFMAAWAPTQCDAFAAAVPIAAVADWLSFHHTTNIPRFDELLLDSDPRTGHAEYRRRSPVAHADRCRTPTLLLHGADDRCVPPSQAQQQYQALVEVGCEAELVLYPGAGHGWTGRAQVVDAAERATAWFRRHLGPRDGGDA
ncbi:S9 family peptidase [Patulibacter defluvii]|uniref:S9 family peptidase n=1 Tax=Patulibacter defluvii TaxID=3095358 RepID=UPI002A74D549|nr:S9 family peptidase [Patulibacter sp. DM4]